MGSFELLRFAPKFSVIGVSKGLRECGISPALNEKGQANSHYGILEKTLKGDVEKNIFGIFASPTFIWVNCTKITITGSIHILEA